MKINCRRCDICGIEIGGRDFMFKIRIPKVKFGYPELGLKRYDVCESCWTKMTIEVLKKTQEWHYESKEKPEHGKEVVISDGMHYGTGRYEWDSVHESFGWKVNSFEKISSVVYWKEMDELPLIQKEEIEKK